MNTSKIFRLTPLLGGFLLVACGGGGDTASTNTSNTPSTVTPPPASVVIPLDKSQALTVSAQDGSIPTPYQFSPLSKDHSVFFKANGNDVWRLQSMLATLPESPFINPAAAFGINVDANDPSKIISFDYSQGLSEQDSWGVSCYEGCAEKYRYKIEKQGQKYYFILDVNAQQQTVTVGTRKRTITNQASVSGQIKFQVDPSWPIWNADRFPVHQYQGDVTVNGVTAPVRSLLMGYDRGRRVFIVDLKDDQKSSMSYGFGNDELLHYSYKDKNGKDVSSLHVAADGKPAIVEEIDQVKGERLVSFNKSGFVSPFGYKPQPAISISGQISEKIIVGSVDAQGEIFSPKLFQPYVENDSIFYWFSQDNLNLNVKYNPTTKAFDLAYQKPQAGVININIFQKFNCQLVNGTCQGIRFSEDKTQIHLEGVVLKDGRVLNGVIRNIGIKT